MTIFDKILSREIKADIVYENDYVLAFKDINPKAKVHILVIPKIKIESVDDLNKSNIEYIKHIFEAIPKIATQNMLDKGYRVVTNVKEHGGQEVYHLHFHILGGEQLGEIC